MNIVKYSNFQEINEEGMWDNIKYGISKLGRYKADGKILGKGETDKKAAAEIEQIMNDTSNALIKATYDKVVKINPEFPNGKSRRRFLESVILYGQLYDSIVAATKKGSKEEGYLDANIANKIIENLRKVVKKALDTDLKAVYSVMDSKENIDLDAEELLFEQLESEEVNEEFLKGLTKLKDKAMDKLFGKKDQDSDARKAGNRQSAKLAGAGDDGTVDSTRMKTLASNKLPLILAGTGAALGALGWMAQTEWFKNWLQGIMGTTKIVQTPAITKDITGGPADKQGFVHWAGKIMGKDIKTGADMQGFVNKFGAENVSHMFDSNGGGDSMGQMQKLQQMISANPQATMGDIFNKANDTFGSMSGGQNLFGVSGTAKFFATIVVKQGAKFAVKTGAGAVATAVGLGPILATIGIGLASAGAALKILREKGMRQSRAKTLNDLLQTFKLVPVPEANAEEGGNNTGDESTTSTETTKADSSSIYKIMIKNLTALNSMLITYTGVTLEGEETGGKPKPTVEPEKIKEMENSELVTLEPTIELEEKEQSDAEKILVKQEDVTKSFDDIYKELIAVWKKQQEKEGKNLTPGEGTRKRLKVLAKFKLLAAEWAKNQEEQGKNTKPGQGTRTRLMKVAKEWYNATYAAKEEVTAESIIYSYTDLLLEKQFTKGPRRSVVGKDETHLTQAVQNVRKSLRSIKDEKDKGVGITAEFVKQILDVKMAKESIKPIKDLYKEIYEYLYGKKAQTLGEFGPLYKESINYLLPKTSQNTQGGKLQVVAEKMARLSKRTLQFEKEGFYSGLGEFGEDLKDYNESLRQIMDFYKNNSEKVEESIIRFTNFK